VEEAGGAVANDAVGSACECGVSGTAVKMREVEIPVRAAVLGHGVADVLDTASSEV
jgi:hypothetical protein